MTSQSSRARHGALDTVHGLVVRFPVTAGAVALMALGALTPEGVTALAAVPARPALVAGVHQPIWTWVVSGLVSEGSIATVIALLAAPFVLGLS
jgi:hypothetical protein